jgi:uncharacterized protein YgiM (DUF1202 family)
MIMENKEMIIELKKKLHEGAVEFSYKKKNGDIRDAVGTLNSEVYGDENKPKGTGYEADESQIRYYDLNSEGWRSFIAENLISIKEND